MIAAMNTKPHSLALLGGAALLAMITCLGSCNAIDRCFGGKDETSVTACGKCGGTSCNASCAAGHAEGDTKLVHSCTLSAADQKERAEKLKATIFSKAVATRELTDGYAFEFREPASFTAELEEVAAFERKCCATFTWAVVPTEGGQELRVTGGAAKEEIASGLRRLGWME
jgi:hypothetical protein